MTNGDGIVIVVGPAAVGKGHRVDPRVIPDRAREVQGGADGVIEGKVGVRRGEFDGHQEPARLQRLAHSIAGSGGVHQDGQDGRV